MWCILFYWGIIEIEMTKIWLATNYDFLFVKEYLTKLHYKVFAFTIKPFH